MTTAALPSILILVSALLHATVNAMVKTSDDGPLTRGRMNAMALVIAAPLTLFVPAPSDELWLLLILAMLVHDLYPFFVVAAHRYGNLRTTFPLARGIAPLGVIGLMVFDGGEDITVWQAMSVALISLGIAGFALEKTAHTQSGGKKAFGFAAATGLIIAVYTTIDGIGLRMAESPLAFIAWFFVLDGAFVTLAVIAARSGQVEPFLRRNWRHGMIAGILGVVTYGSALFALGLGITLPHVTR